jgi:hypothetical protein
MMDKDQWPNVGGPSVTPKDAPTPLQIKAEIEYLMKDVASTIELTKIMVWQNVALVKINLFFDRPLEPEEVDVVNDAVAAEVRRLEALKPPPPPQEPKTGLAKWGLTPREPEKAIAEPPAARGRVTTRSGREAAVAAPAAPAAETATGVATVDPKGKPGSPG